MSLSRGNVLFSPIAGRIPFDLGLLDTLETFRLDYSSLRGETTPKHSTNVAG